MEHKETRQEINPKLILKFGPQNVHLQRRSKDTMGGVQQIRVVINSLVLNVVCCFQDQESISEAYTVI